MDGVSPLISMTRHKLSVHQVLGGQENACSGLFLSERHESSFRCLDGVTRFCHVAGQLCRHQSNFQVKAWSERHATYP